MASELTFFPPLLLHSGPLFISHLVGFLALGSFSPVPVHLPPE